MWIRHIVYSICDRILDGLACTSLLGLPVFFGFYPFTDNIRLFVTFYPPILCSPTCHTRVFCWWIQPLVQLQPSILWRSRKPSMMAVFHFVSKIELRKKMSIQGPLNHWYIKKNGSKTITSKPLGKPWKALGRFGNLWEPLENHRNLWTPFKNPWKTLESFENCLGKNHRNRLNNLNQPLTTSTLKDFAQGSGPAPSAHPSAAAAARLPRHHRPGASAPAMDPWWASLTIKCGGVHVG